MNIHPDNRTAFEFDNNVDIGLEELRRASFLARPSVMLGIKPYPDGNEWCALYGENIMTGVYGFGDSPDEAMLAFDKEWYKNKGGVTI